MTRVRDTDKLIGIKVMRVRKAMNLTRDDVAKKLGISHQQFSKYENGINRISVSMLLDIAKVLKCGPSYFYEDCVNENSSDYKRTNFCRAVLNFELATCLEEIDNYNIQEAILILAESISKEFKALRG